MTTFSLSHRLTASKAKSITLPSLSWKLIYTIVILACFILSVFYVLSINQLTQGAYTIKKYNNEIVNLSKENRSMEADFAEVGLLEQIHSKVRELGFEKTKDIKYIEILDASLAKK